MHEHRTNETRKLAELALNRVKNAWAGADPPLTEAHLDKVCGGYIGETEKNRR